MRLAAITRYVWNTVHASREAANAIPVISSAVRNASIPKHRMLTAVQTIPAATIQHATRIRRASMASANATAIWWLAAANVSIRKHPILTAVRIMPAAAIQPVTQTRHARTAHAYAMRRVK